MMERLRRIRDIGLVRTHHGTGPAGTPLPPRSLRMGGEHFRDDAAFVSSAVAEVRRLEAHGLRPESRLIDWGCGAGRLAIGCIESGNPVAGYHGVDVQRPLIRWAQRHLTRPGMSFTHVDVANARYNPHGQFATGIPGDTAHYNAFYAYSVFSHLTGRDAAAYLREVRRLLRADGFAFLTAFVESDVVVERENPPGYGPMDWRGALHCVRFSRDFFERMIADAGLRVEVFEHGRETDGQSLFVLRVA